MVFDRSYYEYLLNSKTIVTARCAQSKNNFCAFYRLIYHKTYYLLKQEGQDIKSRVRRPNGIDSESTKISKIRL